MDQQADSDESGSIDKLFVRPPDSQRGPVTPTRARYPDAGSSFSTPVRRLASPTRTEIRACTVPTSSMRAVITQRSPSVVLAQPSLTITGDEGNEITRRRLLEAVQAAAAEVNAATVKLVAACAARGGFHKNAADKILDYMAEDVTQDPL